MVAAGAAAENRSPGSAAKLSIGQVLQRLNPEFPEVTTSKLRFLEDQGLLFPTRSASGYRKYSHDDVERVREILTMQRDLYLPLKVIGTYLDERDRGLEPEMPGSRAPKVESMLVGASEMDRRALIQRAGATPALLDNAVSAGLIAPAGPYRDDELSILTALVELARDGIEPRHLRSFRAATQHELGLIESARNASRRTDRQTASSDSLEIARRLASVRAGMMSAAIRSEAARNRG